MNTIGRDSSVEPPDVNGAKTDTMTLDQAWALVERDDPQDWYLQAAAFDRAHSAFVEIEAGFAKHARAVTEVWQGSVAAGYSAWIENMTSLLDTLSHGSSYGNLLRQAGDALALGQRRLHDLQLQRTQQPGADGASIDAQARQALSDLATVYEQVGRGMTDGPTTLDAPSPPSVPSMLTGRPGAHTPALTVGVHDSVHDGAIDCPAEPWGLVGSLTPGGILPPVLGRTAPGLILTGSHPTGHDQPSSAAALARLGRPTPEAPVMPLTEPGDGIQHPTTITGKRKAKPAEVKPAGVDERPVAPADVPDTGTDTTTVKTPPSEGVTQPATLRSTTSAPVQPAFVGSQMPQVVVATAGAGQSTVTPPANPPVMSDAGRIGSIPTHGLDTVQSVTVPPTPPADHSGGHAPFTPASLAAATSNGSAQPPADPPSPNAATSAGTGSGAGTAPMIPPMMGFPSLGRENARQTVHSGVETESWSGEDYPLPVLGHPRRMLEPESVPNDSPPGGPEAC